METHKKIAEICERAKGNTSIEGLTQSPLLGFARIAGHWPNLGYRLLPNIRKHLEFWRFQKIAHNFCANSWEKKKKNGGGEHYPSQ